MKGISHYPYLTLASTQIICEASVFLRNLILARLIGVDEMGLAVALALGIRVIEMIGDLGLERLLIHVESETLPDMRATAHLVQLVKGVCLAITAAMLAQPLTQTINPEIDPAVFALAALAFAFRGAVNLNYRERQRHGEYIPALIVEGGSNFAATLAILPIAYISRDYTAIAWAWLIQAVMLCSFSHMMANRTIKFHLHQATLRRALRYGLPVALNGALMFAALQGDRVIVALHFSAADLARFVIAAQLALLPVLMGGRYILAAELPILATLATNPKAARTHLITRLRWVSGIAVCTTVTLGWSGNMIIQTLYGESYVISSTVFWLLVSGAGLRFIRYVPNALLISREQTKIVLLSNLPRLFTLPLALYMAAQGASLSSIVALGVLSEALSLTYALLNTLELTAQPICTNDDNSLEASW